MHGWYDEIYDHAVKALPVLEHPPVLRVTYSTNKSCETINLNGINYIIYDQNLGQSMNMMNRLFFNSTDKDDAIMYGYKLLAENFQLMGRPDIGAAFVLQHVKLKENATSYKIDIDPRRRAAFTLTQECFVLVHELMHIVLSQRDSQPLLASKREMILETMTHRVNIVEAVHEYLSDIDSAFDDTESERLTPKQIRAVEKEFAKNQEEFIAERSAELTGRVDILEECVVDEWAAWLTTAIVKRAYGVSLIDSLQAILIGLHSLRLMAISNNQAARMSRSTIEPRGYIFESLIRVSNYRSTTNMFFGRKWPRINRKIHQEFVKANRRYASAVQDPILFVVEDQLASIDKALLRGKAPISRQDPRELNRLIDTVI